MDDRVGRLLGMADRSRQSPVLTNVLRRAQQREWLGVASDSSLIVVISIIGIAIISIVVHSLLPTSWTIVWLWVGVIAMITGGYLLTHLRFDQLATAMRLDALNQTDDLLATAWTLKNQDENWSHQIATLADAKATEIEYPSAFGRFAPRVHLAAWMGCVAGVVAMLMISTPEHLTRSTNDSSSNPIRSASNQTIASALRPVREGTSDAPRADEPQSTNNQQTSEAKIGSNNTAEAGSDAAGDGRANAVDITPLTQTNDGGNATPSQGDRSQDIASGSGNAGIDGKTAGPAGAVTTQDRANQSPWANSSWAKDRQNAMSQIRSGNIPAGQRDLVRDYFQR